MSFFPELLKILVEHNQIRRSEADARLREVETRLYPDKRAVYKKALDAWWALLSSMRGKSAQTPTKRLLDALTVAKYEMMLFASAEVVTLWNEMERTALLVAKSDRERLLYFDRVVRAMRKDLGYDDSELEEGQLFALVIRGDDKDTLLDP